jgi:hypothetical protein
MDNAKSETPDRKALGRPKRAPNPDPETLAIQALGFIATDEDLLRRFLGETGCDPGDIRARAQDPAFLGGVLDFLLAWEPHLLAFARQAEIAPEAVATARRKLPGSPVE